VAKKKVILLIIVLRGNLKKTMNVRLFNDLLKAALIAVDDTTGPVCNCNPYSKPEPEVIEQILRNKIS